MHLLSVVRAYLSISQSALAKSAGITHPDLCEMERHKPYGKIYKYQKLSDYLGIPVDAIVKNDCRRIPLSFFDKHTVPAYRPAPKHKDALVGRMGEEFILQREKTRLQNVSPALSGLVVPCYKMPVSSPGYDIITFDEEGHPYFLEVKTSLDDHKVFRLSNHEMDSAQRLTKNGERYMITYVSNFGTDQQQSTDISFANLTETHRVTPFHYFCTPLRESPSKPVTGLAYFRRLHHLRQREISEALNIPTCNWCLYETGQRTPSITTYLKISELLDVSIDELMATYPVLPDEEPAYE